MTIGIYATNSSNLEIAKIRNAIQKEVLSHPTIKQMHGFYCDQEIKSISFDVIVDFKDKNSTAVIEEIKKNLVDKFPEYHFYIVEDTSLTVLDKFRLHGAPYIEHLTGGSALHCNLEEHLTQQQYMQLLEVAAKEGCNYFTFNIPNTICNDCGHIDKRYLKECPKCHSHNVDYLTRVIGYLRRVSNFSKPRQEEASRRFYATM